MMIIKRMNSFVLGLLILSVPEAHSMSVFGKILGLAQPLRQTYSAIGSFCLRQTQNHPATLLALLISSGAAAGIISTLVKKNALLTKTLSHKRFTLSKMLHGIKARVPQEDHTLFAADLKQAIKDGNSAHVDAYCRSGIQLPSATKDDSQGLLEACNTAFRQYKFFVSLTSTAQTDLEKDKAQEAKTNALKACTDIRQWQAAGVTLEHNDAATQILINIFEQLTPEHNKMNDDDYMYYFELAKSLVELKARYAEKTASDKQKEQASICLHRAISQNQDDLFKLMIEAGFDINTTYSITGDTPLHHAIRQLKTNDDDTAIIEYICSHPMFKADTYNKKTSSDGKQISLTKNIETPLHLAAFYGYTRVVQLLLEHNADINAKDCFGETPLMKAIAQRHKKLVQFLYDYDAKLNEQDSLGKTELMHIPTTLIDEKTTTQDSSEPKKSSLFNLFTGDCSTEQYWKKASPEIMAIFTQSIKVLKNLVSYDGINLASTDNAHKTILHHLMGTQLGLMLHLPDHLLSEENEKKLVEDAELKKAVLPVMVSLAKQAKEIMDKLFQDKSIVSALDRNGETALMKACKFGDYLSADKILRLHKETTIDQQDSQHNTAFMHALTAPKTVRGKIVQKIFEFKPQLLVQGVTQETLESKISAAKLPEDLKKSILKRIQDEASAATTTA